MNGFELCEKILAIDINVRVCIMSSEINHEVLREIYPATSLGCFIRKPVSIDYLVNRIMSELDYDLICIAQMHSFPSENIEIRSVTSV
jgi:DNA-binding NarL/FixJ family response regulator